MHPFFSLGFSDRFLSVLCTHPPPSFLFCIVLFMYFEIYISLLTVWEKSKALKTSVSRIVFIKIVWWGSLFFLQSLIYIFPLLLSAAGAVACCCFAECSLGITQRYLVGYFLLAWLTLSSHIGKRLNYRKPQKYMKMRVYDTWKYQWREISLNCGTVICRVLRLEDICHLKGINFFCSPVTSNIPGARAFIGKLYYRFKNLLVTKGKVF